MEKINLNGMWNCKLLDGRALQVEVPGCYDTYIEEKNWAKEVVFERTFEMEAHYELCQLWFEGVSYYCDIFVNDVFVGSHEGIWDRFYVDIENCVKVGENSLRLHVTKPGYDENDRFPLREVLSGFVPDVLCTFGGIWDDVYLACANEILVEHHFAKGTRNGNVEISVDVFMRERGCCKIWGRIIDAEGRCADMIKAQTKHLEQGKNTLVLQREVFEPKLWSNESPNLYKYQMYVEKDGQDVYFEHTFGFREICADGSKILLNGKPTYLRGVLHWGFYDEIIPNPSVEVIASEIEKIKAYDFNMIKHCLYIPREEYLQMADEAGMLLWIELPLWLPDVTPELGPRMRREFPAILKQLAGHPSVVLVSLGCELNDKVSSAILEEMYLVAKKHSDALVRDNSGSGECYDGLSVDYADFFDYHFYGDLQNMEPLMETFTPSWRNYRPWIFGEFCDSDTMRDLNEVRKGKGTDKIWWEVDDAVKNPISVLKPDFRMGQHDERMKVSGIREDFAEIKELSYDHAMVHRKVTLEQTRSFAEIMGYNITSIRDVPIATSGMFDDMMEPKFPVDEVRKINGDVVLVPAWDLTRIWINADRVMNRERYNFFGGENYRLHVLLSNYKTDCIKHPVLEYSLCGQGEVKSFDTISLHGVKENYGLQEVAYLSFQLPEVEKPVTLELRVKMKCDAFEVENSWPIFVYPKVKTWESKIGLYDPANVWATVDGNLIEIDDDAEVKDVDMVFASRLTKNIKEYLQNGGKVIYMQRGKGSLPVTPIAFWREGMIRRFDHPVLEELEKTCWMDDLRYFSVSTDTAFRTDELESLGFSDIKPMLRRYDCREWQATDYLLEATYGKGKIFMTTLRLEGNMGKQPMFIENNVLARWLLDKIRATLL